MTWHYREPGKYLKLVKTLREYFTKYPDATPLLSWDQFYSREEWNREVRMALHSRINRKVPPEQRPVTCSEEKTWDYEWDRDRIHEYLFQRVRHSGCRGLLRTPRLKRRYPFIDNQPRCS